VPGTVIRSCWQMISRDGPYHGKGGTLPADRDDDGALSIRDGKMLLAAVGILIFICIPATIPGFTVVELISGIRGDQSSPGYIIYAGALTAAPSAGLAVAVLLHNLMRLVRLRLPDRAGLVLALTLALAAYAAVITLASTVHLNDKRCVDTRAMRVAAAQYCQSPPNPAMPNLPGLRYRWYYGGSGDEEGETVRGGSFTAPDEESGRGGVGEDGGDE
jgi:hypothetical protein